MTLGSSLTPLNLAIRPPMLHTGNSDSPVYSNSEQGKRIVMEIPADENNSKTVLNSSVLAGILILGCILSRACVANDLDSWLQFRGTNSAGRAASSELATKLDIAKQLLWKVEVSAGHSSPIVLHDRIVLTAFDPGVLSTLCFAKNHGALLWRRDVPVASFETSHPQHGPASPTPVSDGKRIYVVFGSYGILCYQLDGVELWHSTKPLSKNMFGSASSPVLIDNKLIVHSGTEQESLLQALDPTTGAVLWERRRPGPASTWSTPIVWQNASNTILVFYEPFHLRACSLKDGSDIWSVPGLADEPVTVPQIHGNRIFVTSYNLRTNREANGLPSFEDLLAECDADRDGAINAYEAKTNRSILSRPEADGQGDHPLRMFFRMLDENKDGVIRSTEWPRIHKWMEPWTHANGVIALQLNDNGLSPVHDWQHESGVPECPSPLVWEELLFMVRNGGVVTCLEATTGKKWFAERLGGGGPYYASPIAADNKLIFASSRGIITMIDAANQLRIHSQCNLGESLWATPAIAQSKLAVRTERHLWFFDIGAKN